ncbi:MAG: carboxypeptidase regulatory-like domain-containing protein [Endomicrobiales bacterium]|nr:carboxypeptidase regulatory-like domain-containing protein [Endomicrobiales bacterium]
MKNKTIFLCSIVIFLAASSGLCATITSVQVLDSLRAVRTNYSSSENVVLSCKVSSAEEGDRINFEFNVYDPANSLVFRHTGNSIPGTVGAGGSEVGNVSISRFYTNPGSYALEVTVTDGAGTVSQRTAFSVYSPIIILTYPSNGARDLVDQPLVFRWVGSGASKYKIYVDDDQSFYNTMYTAETTLTNHTYPQNPTDQRQKLAGGQEYYWKVEGLDASGNRVASSQIPFSFTLKQSGASNTRDLGISKIYASDESAPPQLAIKVEVVNAGSQAESNVTLTLYVAGMVYGTQKIAIIGVAETKTMTFLIEPPVTQPGQPLFVSATHDLFDDNVQNNILTAPISIKEGFWGGKFAKILGKITVSGEKSGIENAKIEFSGPKSGETASLSGGQYKVEGLFEGTYKIKVTHPDFEPEEKTVTVEKEKAYPNIDFELKKLKGKGLTLAEIWKVIEIELPIEIAGELSGYELFDITGAGKKTVDGLIEQIKKGSAKITEASVSY